LIATAAFGSEVTPQIQFLIDFRDHRVMSTLTGSSFMTVANAWYYSFSPYVADYERQHSWFKETVKASIYPLLGIFMLAEKPYSSINGDLGTLTSGLIASSLIGVVYLWPIAIAIKHVRNNRFNPKVAIALVAVVFMSVLLATLSANQYALMITTPLSFLLILSISSVLTARMISKITRRLSKKNSTDTTTYHSSHKSMGV